MKRTNVNYYKDVNSNNLTLQDGNLYCSHDTTSQIRKGMKTHCFHGFRSFENVKYVLKGLLQV